MEQITWTAPGHLVDLARSRARRRGLTLNDYLTEALDRATRRDLREEAEHLRRRLDVTRLAVSSRPARRGADQVEVSSAGAGTSLPELVGLNRGE